MFVLGGLSILLVVLFLLLAAISVFSRKLTWFGQLPGDIRYVGQHTRVYYPASVYAPAVFSLEFGYVPRERNFIGGSKSATGGKGFNHYAANITTDTRP